jgi:hypothetical protein
MKMWANRPVMLYSTAVFLIAAIVPSNGNREHKVSLIKFIVKVDFLIQPNNLKNETFPLGLDSAQLAKPGVLDLE